MKTVAKNISQSASLMCVSYSISKEKLDLLTTHQPLGFCTVTVATPPGVSLHIFRGSSHLIGLIACGTQKKQVLWGSGLLYMQSDGMTAISCIN